MSDNRNYSVNVDEMKPPRVITEFAKEFLDEAKYIAIVIRQNLRPDDDGTNPVIFPPTYPMSASKGRIHTIRDGEYRVSVELPADAKGKDESTANQKAGYNIDYFPGCKNSCEIDSPQSQANRIEPRLNAHVPKVTVQVGNDPVHAKKVNLLDAGHRAADAVIRLSSLAAKFHEAFLAAKLDNHFPLATIAPTSLVFGVWDSRSTYVKLQRVVKAYIRATNVQLRSRSAQYTPAADYVAAGAVDEDTNKKEGGQGSETTSMSSEGMLHALATQTAGGVSLTESSTLVRTVVLNLNALRDLKASDGGHREALQSYILALALLAATREPDLKLREGCNLRLKDSTDITVAVPRRGDDEPITLDDKQLATFATEAEEAFFELAKQDFKPTDAVKEFQKDHEAVFETGVAEKFLQMSKNDRAAIGQLGPITETTFKLFEAKKSNPFSTVLVHLKEIADKKTLGPKPKKNEAKAVNLEAFDKVTKSLQLMTADQLLTENVRESAERLKDLIASHTDAHATLKAIENEIKEFNKSIKALSSSSNGSADSQPATENEVRQ
jgi:CRISPR-associated protein Csb1